MKTQKTHLKKGLLHLLLICLSFNGWGQSAQLYFPGGQGTYTESACVQNSDCDDLDAVTMDRCNSYGCLNLSYTGLPPIQYAEIDLLGNNIYLSHYGGVIQYNGQNILNLDKKSSGYPLLPHQWYDILNMAIASNGEIWLAGIDSLLAPIVLKYSPLTNDWTEYNHQVMGIPSGWINGVFPREIEIDQNDHVWVGFDNANLLHFDGSNWTFTDLPTVTGVSGFNNNSMEIEFYGSNEIWVSSGPLYHFDGTNWQGFTNPGFTYAEDLAIDNNGDAWMISLGAAVKFDGSWTQYNLSGGGMYTEYLQEICTGNGDTMWINTLGNGVHFFDGTNWTLWNTANSSIPLDNFSDMDYDPATGMLLAISQNGLAQFDGVDWTLTETDHQGIGDGAPNTFTDPTGTTWILGLDSLMSLYNGQLETYPIHGRSLTSAAMTSNGTLWLSSGAQWLQALLSFDGQSFQSHIGDISDSPSSVVVDSNDNVWVSTFDEGLWMYDGISWTNYNVQNSPLSTNYISKLHIGSNGALYIVIINGVYEFDNANFSLYYQTNQTIRDSYMDAFDRFWLIGANASLILYDGQNTVIYDVNNSPFEGFLAKIFVDSLGRPWLTEWNGNLWNLKSGQWNLWGEPQFGLPADSTQHFTIDHLGNAWFGNKAGISMFQMTLTPDSVWPGDANYDGIANNVDLLAVGQGYGTPGPDRPNASLVWMAQEATPWIQSLPLGTNYMHVDTDGDGEINDDDTLAINLNFGLTHNRGGGGHNGNVPLWLVPDQDSLGIGDTLQISIQLGTDSLMADSIYGIAFTVNYDPALVDSGSAKVGYSNSWMGMKGLDMITIHKDFYPSGQVPMALSRIDQQNISGFGEIATLEIIMVDDISGKGDLKDSLLLYVSDIHFIRVDGSTETVSTDSIYVEVNQPLTDGIDRESANYWKIFPNPASNKLHLLYQKPFSTSLILTLQTIDGAEISRDFITSPSYQKDISAFSPGMYILKLEEDEKISYRKLLITR